MLIAQNWVTGLLGHANDNWSVSAEELDAGFVRVGFETEGHEPIPETTGPLVLGRVSGIEELTGFKKPIRYCQVDVGRANGSGEPQGIICGARNFAEGDLVVVALPGAELPGGFKISARETYDHVSEGMICSAAELGLADKQNSGIITLSDDYGQPGDDARELIGLHDTVFDVNITPDRGYALSARGLTRELASAFDLVFSDPAENPAVAGVDTSAVPAASGELLGVDVREETKAIRFGLRKVSGIDPSVESPYWLQRELMLSGQRSVNATTDVTNYVMLLLGQPMHAFDAGRITGGLTVRNAGAGEKFETLDHVTRELSSEDVVICDETGIQSMAGVMGGTSSEISETTTDVYFEAATWDPKTVARTSRRHKLSSESSRRFERGVDPAVVEVALDIACALLVEIAGGTVEAGRTLIGEVPGMPTIGMRATHPSELAGVEYPRETVINRLREVGCDVVDEGETLQVTPPTWRTDIGMPADLVEEVLRLEGLEDIPLVLPTPAGGRGLTREQRRRRAVGHALAYNGYAEILPSPFIANDTFDAWELGGDDPRRNAVTVQNPLEADRAILGTTLLPSMLDAVARNVARGRTDVALFGLQQVSFAREDVSPMPSVDSRPDEETVRRLLDSLPEQPLHVATVGTGRIEFEGPWGNGRAYSYADAIESARVVARGAGVELEVESAEHLPWHPGRCAALKVGDRVVGHAGELHPQILERLELPARTCAMELDVTALPLEEKLPAPVLSAYPALHQDIALVVDESVPAETVRKVVAEGAGELLESVELFDIFHGEQLGEDRKSLAFSLLFRAGDRTLTDEEVNVHRLAAAELAKERLGAELRA
ncbi:phenylalanine--tRNA ligase subunit beta [Corynebacterium halotolerans]|uniref:Phenylalanine--tRNA ligase beta subunit n=1 Tax=Corynebacterium halotolerans YIM 70093 = DSM 44683 TaxID=1121362 RepID=M1NXZ4_9CORY|nr:phenylalanine--tRNA ligase subunit beta [Corynebacterium halotolerans]AGF72370.1 phenylalanyl-tRNA ligase subunit beta [Corynebacterium halotolerans YIM 70093 = DSM 44683]